MLHTIYYKNRRIYFLDPPRVEKDDDPGLISSMPPRQRGIETDVAKRLLSRGPRAPVIRDLLFRIYLEAIRAYTRGARSSQ